MIFKNVVEGNFVKDSRGIIYEVDLVQTNTKMFRAFCKGTKGRLFSSVWTFAGELKSYDDTLDRDAKEVYITEICLQQKYPELYL